MDEVEVWVAAYLAAVAARESEPAIVADIAVEDFNDRWGGEQDAE